MITAAVILLLTAALILLYNFTKSKAKPIGDYTASIESLIFSGDYEKAVEDCEDGLRNYPESAELYILKARAYALSGDLPKAIGTLDYGYKQTRSEAVLDHRSRLSLELVDDIRFLPLDEQNDPQIPDSPNSSGNTASGSETSTPTSASAPANTAEAYKPDPKITINIPDTLEN